MKIFSPALLGFAYLTSEVLLVVTRRAHRGTSGGDAYSLGLLWSVIGLSIFAAIKIAFAWPAGRLPNAEIWTLAGILIFIAALILRWTSIIQLGRFFTVDVAIAADHQLVEDGPYRYVRHPSYTGALFAFLGFGLTLGNWASVVVMMVPIFLVFTYRIKVEERALVAALGESYVAYRQRTKRLLPFIY
ncbi:MAG: isoprenylcysteine carboxylmethyltransferase family protein [Chthoniobacterales bacterium]